MLLLTESLKNYCVSTNCEFNWIIKKAGAAKLLQRHRPLIVWMAKVQQSWSIHWISLWMCNVQEPTKCKRYTNSLMSRDLLSDARSHMPCECSVYSMKTTHTEIVAARGAGRPVKKKQCPFQPISYCLMTNDNQASPNVCMWNWLFMHKFACTLQFRTKMVWPSNKVAIIVINEFIKCQFKNCNFPVRAFD